MEFTDHFLEKGNIFSDYPEKMNSAADALQEIEKWRHYNYPDLAAFLEENFYTLD